MSRIMYVSGKCSDMCDVRVPHLRIDKDGYVPSSVGGGDYIQFAVDLDTGTIVNWEPITDDQLKQELGTRSYDDE